MIQSHSFHVIFFFAVAAVGVVSPFVFGSVPDVQSSRSYESYERHEQPSTQSPSPLFQHSRPYTAVPRSATLSSEEKGYKSRIRRLFSRLNPSSGKTDGRWKGGESKATIPARMLFTYVSPLLDLASSRTLTEDDAFAVVESRKMDRSVDSLAEVYGEVRRKAQKKIEEQREKGADKVKNSQTSLLLKALVKQQSGMLLLTGFLRLLNTGVQAFPAILVSRLLQSIEAGNSVPVSKAFSAALMLVSVLSLKMMTENQYFHNVVSMATKTRGSLEGLVFDKSLRLPDGGSGVIAKQRGNNEKKALGSGGVLNLIQSDASFIENAAMQIHTLWDGPLQIAMYTTLLYKYLGPSVLYGLAVLLTVIPINSITLRILDRLSTSENEARDARTKRTTESVNNMKLLKVQGWEEQFASDIKRHRADELNRHKTRGVIRAINSAISNAVPALVLVVTLAAYAKTGKPIVASKIFTAISLFNQLRFPLFFYPMLIDAVANGKNSLRRISSYLTSEELTPYVQTVKPIEGGRIELKNGNFLWSTSEAPKDGQVSAAESPALCNVNMEVQPGQVVAVVGPVGSGKSALIKALLGELAPVPRMVVDSSSTGTANESGIDRPFLVMHGDVAYCSQEAWLPKGTIRDAIVFGRDYDEERYRAAIYDAGLDKDMDRSDGVLSDETDVGESGSNLSGGQRARVALARALYSGDEAKVFLLDDCLAALDATVGSLVFDRVTKRIKATKAAAVIVTNDPSLPRRCDEVILMGPTGGNKSTRTASSCSTIIEIGSYDELLKLGHQLQSYSETGEETSKEAEGIPALASREHEVSLHQEETDISEGASKSTDMIRVTGGYRVNATSIDHTHADPDCAEIDCRNCPDSIADRAMGDKVEIGEREEDGHAGRRQTDDTSETDTVAPSRPYTKPLSTDDSMSSKAVPLSTYLGYLKAVQSPALMGAMLTAFFTANGAQFFQQYTVAKWTEVAGDAATTALGGGYLQSLAYAAVVVSVFLWLRSYLTMLVGTRASTFYHDRMVGSIFRAPMSFFDATPSGQILSRFGKELGTVDRALPDSLASVLFCALQIGSSAMALAGAITPAMMAPMLFAGSLYLRTMKRFRPAARDMKRSESKTRSPIFTHFGEALRGTEVIRSVPGAVMTWSRKHRELSDTNLAVFSTVKALDRWLSVTLEFVGNSMVFAAALASVVLSRAGRIKPGAAGWGLTQSLAITGLMAWAVRNLTMLESHMMSVMRVRELTDLDAEEVDLSNASEKKQSTMPKELKGVGEALNFSFPNDQKPNITVSPLTDAALKADGWPWKGDVRFNRVSMRYNPSSPLVLKDVTIQVPPGSTLGVVGRTGSGKSSLLLTLFRICEIENGGSIEIDGVDIRSISIQTLRERLSIIPQDPVLFAGTIGSNLDATGKASEEEMWAALVAASPDLAKQFRESGGLGSAISEGGGNLSQGQRQLICLARALLRKSKILVMDEATSSVDATTDQQVQATIRREFVNKGVSVITVAHRLDTVLGYDKIAVLGDGNMLEYGSPSDLLKNREGELRQLVEADRRNKMRGGKTAQMASA